MSSGLPVVVPNSGGVTDFVEDGESGLFFESEDQNSLVESVTQLLANPDTARQMGRAGRAKAESMSWDQVNDAAIQEFIALIRGHDLRQKRRRLRFLRPISTVRDGQTGKQIYRVNR
jgi:glycosyltransferase involved in cell wall biosynthesis